MSVGFLPIAGSCAGREEVRCQPSLRASSITFPMITVNVAAITLAGSVVVMHWALWAMANGDRRNSYIALGLTVVLGFATLNALAFSFNQMHLAVNDNVYSVMVVSIAGAFILLLVSAMVFIGLTAFRTLDPLRALAVGVEAHFVRKPRYLGLKRLRQLPRQRGALDHEAHFRV